MISFVGAGPGDPDLITIKGRQRIESADVIIYAGSLVHEGHLAYAKSDAEILNSAYMDLDEVLACMVSRHRAGKSVVRLHTGDPSVYGAIREQMDPLAEANIPYEVIPGVSSFSAAAAVLKREYTLPGVSQTVILTRRAGRTPVPEGESIEALAAHKASMAIFLSAGQIENVARELAQSYAAETPVAVVYRASWEDERVVCSTVGTIAKDMEGAGIRKHALILVGDFLGDRYENSKLYDPGFSTEYRKAKR